MDLLHAEVANLLVWLAVALLGRWWHGVLSIAPLKRDIFRVDVARGLLVMACRRGLRLRLAARLEELNLGGVYLGGLALLAVLAFPGSGLQPALDVDQASLVQVLPGNLRQVALTDVPNHHVVVIGVFLLLTVGALPVAVGRQREAGHRRPARRVAHFRIAGQAADEHHFVQVHDFPSSCRTSKWRKTVSEIFKTRSTSWTFAWSRSNSATT